MTVVRRPWSVVRKAILCLTLSAMLFALSSVAQAQQPAKVPRIGWLTIGFLSTTSARQEAFRQGLRELGYVEGKNILIERRGADNIPERRRALTEELVCLKVDVIVVAGGEPWVRAAKNTTNTIPIVMTGAGIDPVKEGFVESLACPGGNVTGPTSLNTELGGKRLELLKEAVPTYSCRGSL
jgi:ABC-type uncharacterized transport system substrate-binding protein